MAGVGSTLLAALMGRSVICVELEPHFIAPMKASWEKMKMNPKLGFELGQVLILRGDARCLPLSSADAVITSPPFQDQLPAQDIDWFEKKWKGKNKPGVANTPGYTRVDAAVFSPPYANRLADTYVDDDPQRMSYEMGKAKIDAVVTSPPFQDAQAFQDKEFMEREGKAHYVEYGTDKTNIGNQKGDAYWSSMKSVYQECHRVLKPAGIMVLVLKGFTRDGQYIDLPLQTAEMVESLGFTKFDEWTRELWSLSFWRILQKRRDPEAFDTRLMFEYVLAFHKDGEQGNGLDAAMFSPPFAESLSSGPGGIDWTKQADGRKKQEPHGVGDNPQGYSPKEA